MQGVSNVGAGGGSPANGAKGVIFPERPPSLRGEAEGADVAGDAASGEGGGGMVTRDVTRELEGEGLRLFENVREGRRFEWEVAQPQVPSPSSVEVYLGLPFFYARVVFQAQKNQA